jgi:hypothetical protein
MIYLDSSFDLWFQQINCFVELDGGHRFDDQVYRALLMRLRMGELTDMDFALLDGRVVSGKNGLSYAEMPADIQMACHTNKDRNANNDNVFFRHLVATHSKNPQGHRPDHTLVIVSSNHMWKENSRRPTRKAILDLFTRCGECNVKGKNDKFIDPLLKLYYGIPMMMLHNDDVPNGIANGTLCTLKQIVIKPGCDKYIQPMQIDGYCVNSIEAHHVEKLILCHGENNEFLHEMKASEQVCSVQMPLDIMPGIMKEKRYGVKMKMYQFPIIVNSCTTVHKLQGQTKDFLYLTAWHNSRNWAYVALSRIKTLQGLFLKIPMSRKQNVRPHPQLLQMMTYMRNNKRPEAVDGDYV